ncbi:LD-carboxypeptidase [Candidatus Synechococcus calcipolaris G9]|uniref:LD-carboxypeptidase n=1 Tax=Candidatus Synechococcus calcipolaris G9 TaxID=1497997 RepID=A0ABT6EZ88_9SYNE|nr:LD-carboxypeptidase [Candidatus Synechococcus calcipolaris]MDG2990904.1 LD-carboxypeptidase [Candidatus Synechococcus calcipolaris G9]
MIQPQLPAPLQPGDRLGVVFPSGRLRDREPFLAGLQCWRDHGYKIAADDTWHRGWGYLAGSDGDRRQALLDALTNSEIKGILCGRGGFGATRLLEDWAWPALAGKWLIGFSDITALLWSYVQEGVAGVHGPVLTTLAAEPPWSRDRLFHLVQGKSLDPLDGQGWGGGIVTGQLLPGNLAVATHLIHTRHCPDLTGAILAFEDVGEAPYRLDRMLTQWRQTGLLSQVAGIALGRFSRCQVEPSVPSFTAEEVLGDRLADLGLPIVSGLPFGHEGVNAALPVGIMATLDGDRGQLIFG